MVQVCKLCRWNNLEHPTYQLWPGGYFLVAACIVEEACPFQRMLSKQWEEAFSMHVIKTAEKKWQNILATFWKTRMLFWHHTRPMLQVSVVGTKEENVEVVEEFEYLGNTISQDCSLDHEINRRISKASRTFCSLYRVVWCRKRLKIGDPAVFV